SGKGTLTPALPVLKPAEVWFSHAQDKGYRVGGRLPVAGIPHVRQGELAAEVSAAPGGESYGLAASGALEAELAGLTVNGKAEYDRGMFTLSGRTVYERGKAAGNIEVGVTNRAVGKDGRLLNRIGDGLRPFGRGSVTLSLTDWLTGTAGIRLLPSGEI